MEVDYEGNIRASELRFLITEVEAVRANRVGTYQKDGFLRAARELGLEVDLEPKGIVYSTTDIPRALVVVTFTDDWQLPTRR